MDGLEVLLETFDLERRAHAIASRTSILPVTAAVISAVRYSCSRSMAVPTLATIPSIFAVSRQGSQQPRPAHQVVARSARDQQQW